MKYFYRLPTTFLLLIIIFWTTRLPCQAIADTFDTAEIPTYLGAYSSTCNGPLTTISITLPSGGPWTVTGIDISYNMTAQGGGLKLHQRSYIRCQNTATSESTIYQGTGNGGVQAYSRTGVNIANGSYSGNTALRFEMRAWRTAIGAGCSTSNNRVDNFSWIITVHYAQIPDEGSVGIGTTSPATSAILELKSTTQAFLPPRMTTQQRDAIAVPVPGMMLFNTTAQKLEIYTSGWSSMTFSSPGVRKLLGGTDNDDLDAVKQTSDGGFILAGNSSSPPSGTLAGLVNNGPIDAWIVKLDNNSNLQWQKLFGGANDDQVRSIQQTSDGGFIVTGWAISSNTGTLTGITNNGSYDVWVMRLDSNGNIIWQKLFGGIDSDYGWSVQQTSEGGFVVAGYSFSSNTGTLTGVINNGSIDYWILKLDVSGNITWQKLIGGSGAEFCYSIQQASDGGYVVAGQSNSSNTGSMIGLFTNGDYDDWIVKLDNLGNIVWQKLLGGSLQDNAQRIRQTSDGGFIVGGYTSSSNTGTLSGFVNNGGTDAWILKLDDSGNMIWQKLLGGSLADNVQSFTTTSDDGIVFAGTSSSSNTGTLQGLISNGPSDYWIFKLDKSGAFVWQKLLGGSLSEGALGIDQTSDGGYIITGFSGSSNTGTLLGLISNGQNDAWVLKLDANGNPY